MKEAIQIDQFEDSFTHWYQRDFRARNISELFGMLHNKSLSCELVIEAKNWPTIVCCTPFEVIYLRSLN